MRRCLPIGCLILAASCAPPAIEGPPPPAEAMLLHAMDATEGLVGPGSIELSEDHVEGRAAVKWSVGRGTSHGLTFQFDDRGVEAAEWGELRFRYKVVTGGWTWFGIKLCDHPIGDGMQATWRLDGGKGLEPGDWQEAVIDLTEPMYRWGDKPDRESQWLCFRAMADEPAVILLDDVRLTRPALRTRIAERTAERSGSGRVYRWAVELTNPTDVPRGVRVRADGEGLTAFRIAVSDGRVALGPKASRTIRIALTEAPAPGVAPLTQERTTVRLVAEAAPRPIVYPLEIAAMTSLPPHNHPTLLVTRDEIGAIKAKVAKYDWAKKSYVKLVAEADAWLKRPVELPDRGGQWWHWYSCPKCGTRLKTLSPTRHQCPACKKVYSGEPYDSVVLSRVHSDLAKAVETLGLAFQLSGERHYAAKAAEILLAYAERYLTYKRHTTRGQDRVGGGRVGPQTLDESAWLIPVVRGYDLVWETLTDEQRTKIEGKLLRPAAELIMEHKIGIHNIQCWKNSAVGLVGICLDEPRFLADAVTSGRGIHAQLKRGILDDGTWFEGSWGYHYYTMSALEPLAIGLRHVGVDVYTDRYKGLYAAPLDFALPNGLLPAVNDSGEANAYGAWYRYEVAYARWRDPKFAAMLEGRSRVSRDSLLFGEAELEEGAELPGGSRNYPVAGYAYLQPDAGKDAPVAILDYAPHGGGHGHPDKLQLLFYANGEIVAPDPGCIHYGVPLHREWYKQTVSHNTVVVDGKSQKPCQGKLLFFHATPELAVASASADDAYGGTRFARTVALLPEGLCIDVVELASGKPHTYDWAFHCYGEVRTDLPLETGFAPPGRKNGYQHIRDVRGCPTEKTVQIAFGHEKTAVWATMLGQPRTSVYLGHGPGRPPSRRLPTLLVRREGKSALFVTAFWIDVRRRDSECPQIAVQPAPEGMLGLHVGMQSYQWVDLVLPLAFSTSPKATTEPALPIRTDARVAIARRGAESWRALAIARGTRLAVGDTSIACSPPADLSVSYGPDGQCALTVHAQKDTMITLGGLFREDRVVLNEAGESVPTSRRRGALSFEARSGRYLIVTPKD